jgi:hypothetical protein
VSVSLSFDTDVVLQGEIKTNHVAERELKDAAPEIVFIRCAYFMENWASALETLKGDSPFFHSVTSPAGFAFPQVGTYVDIT